MVALLKKKEENHLLTLKLNLVLSNVKLNDLVYPVIRKIRILTVVSNMICME